jgi:zinc/manganese transport system substrate-binding protein
MKQLAVLAASALLLAGCAATPAPEAESDLVTVVASTNVYGNIASAVGREHLEVTNIISSPSQDPHSYEASARDRKAVDDADLVILNGGGYDTFMETLVEASATSAPVINAVEVSGLLPADAAEDDHAEGEEDHDHIEGFNEHVWYSLTAMGRLADQIATDLGRIDPDNASTYAANAQEFVNQIGELQDKAESLIPKAAGRSVALTEPVPGYLIDTIGLVNATPEAFTEAIEEGSDVPPLALQETLDLITSKSVIMLGYNEQTSSPETEKLRDAAEDADINVASFTETLPDGYDYISWMSRVNIAQIEEALI